MILDGDRGGELIHPQAEPTRVLWKKAVVCREPWDRGQSEVPRGALARQRISGAALVASIQPRYKPVSENGRPISQLYFLKVGVELDRMGVGRDPGLIVNQRGQPRPDVKVVLKKVGVLVCAGEEQPPRVSMACEAGPFEARETVRHCWIVGSVNRGDALKCDARQLHLHMRQSLGMPVEIDEIDFPRQRLLGPSNLHLRAKLDNTVGGQVEEVRGACRLFGQGDEQAVLPLRHAGIG